MGFFAHSSTIIHPKMQSAVESLGAGLSSDERFPRTRKKSPRGNTPLGDESPHATGVDCQTEMSRAEEQRRVTGISLIADGKWGETRKERANGAT